MAVTFPRLRGLLLKTLAWTALGLFVLIGTAQHFSWVVLGWTFESAWQGYRTVRDSIFWLLGLKLLSSRLWMPKEPQRCATCRATWQRCNSGFGYPGLDGEEDSIRLVRIVGGLKADEIDCELATFRLDEMPDYNALSYRWIEDDSNYSISLNSDAFNIRGNLYDFLKTMKKETYTGWLFIDAICINQHDIAERSHQVALMRQIYTNATEVIAWLRCETQRSTLDGQELIFQSSPIDIRSTLRKVQTDFDSTPKLSNLPPEAISMAKDAIEKYARDRYAEMWRDAKATTLWHIFLEDDYWTRLWPVQEILLARNLTFRCRRISFDWVDLQILVEEQKPEVHGLYA